MAGLEQLNGAVLLIPLILIRFGLLAILDRGAIKRAAHFPLFSGRKKVAYWIYQLSNAAIFIYLFFLRVETEPLWSMYAGLCVYTSGVALCTVAVFDFAKPSGNGINNRGIYRISRNPMYAAYFIFFSGCALLTRSLVLFGIVLIFQISTHWIIMAEERWCIETFGDEYRQYMNRVRRYL